MIFNCEMISNDQDVIRPKMNIKSPLLKKIIRIKKNTYLENYSQDLNKLKGLDCNTILKEFFTFDIIQKVLIWLLQPTIIATLLIISIIIVIILYKRKKNQEKKILSQIFLNETQVKKIFDTSSESSLNLSCNEKNENLEIDLTGKFLSSSFKNNTVKNKPKFKFQGETVFLRIVCDYDSHNCRNLKKKAVDLLWTNYEIHNENLNQFKGLYRPENILPSNDFVFKTHSCCFVWQYANRGSLFEIIHNTEIDLDWFFKMSLIIDLINGMKYLHDSNIKKHGFLTSKSCVVDSKWLLKITDYNFYEFLKIQKIKPEILPLENYLWTAPELLNLGYEACLLNGNQKSDIYSFSIIIKELIERELPFIDQQQVYSLDELLSSIASGSIKAENLTSFEDFDIPEHVSKIMERCLSYLPNERMSFEEIQNIIQKHDNSSSGKSGKSNIVDNMVLKLKKCSTKLEEMITEKPYQWEYEMKKSDELLYRMLPSSVVCNLRNGIKVQPEKFSDVTVYFCDIVGFTTISMYSGPMEIIELLNLLYTKFDLIIDQHNVYKVETIGDAYMVVSGLPEPCERSSQEICNMALEILQCCLNFKIPHMPSVPLRIRSGIHTGSVVAGVVGHTMPRYSVFGDTVNTASRMESTSRPNRIQISSSTYRKIAPLGIYSLQRRGNVNLNGRGIECTYWLKKRNDKENNLPDFFDDLEEESHGFKDLKLFQNMKQNFKDNSSQNHEK